MAHRCHVKKIGRNNTAQSLLQISFKSDYLASCILDILTKMLLVGFLVRQVGGVDGARLCGGMGEMRAALPPGPGQHAVQEAGGALQRACSPPRRGGPVESQGSPNAVLPGRPGSPGESIAGTKKGRKGITL